ncbi:unnamed protein product [Linum trigynum]|uniref:Uncharacterized protein n=1 Tax=Linum trigynum TaxID=586398 RepID=A0AAV2DKK5_9ROSI
MKNTICASLKSISSQPWLLHLPHPPDLEFPKCRHHHHRSFRRRVCPIPASIATPTFRSFINKISDTVRNGLSKRRPWAELADRSADASAAAAASAAVEGLQEALGYSILLYNIFGSRNGGREEERRGDWRGEEEGEESG